MRVPPNSLAKNLEKGFGSLYLLFGAEILLIEEVLDQLRLEARRQGFTERIRLTVEPGFDWDQILQFGQSMSLFAERRLIELRLPSGKPGDAGGKALQDYINHMNPDTSLVVISGPVEKRSQTTKWFKAMESNGVVSECPAIQPQQLPDWIAQRMSAQGLRYDMAAVQRLGEMVEGNLLAAAQEINLLALLYPDETITTAIMDSIIADHARFNSFALVDASLAGTVDRASRILQSLRREQSEPTLVVWAIARELRSLAGIAAEIASGASQQSVFKKYRVWSSRTGMVGSALRRLSPLQIENLLRKTARTDLMLKGNMPTQRKDIWEEIEALVFGICGVRS